MDVDTATGSEPRTWATLAAATPRPGPVIRPPRDLDVDELRFAVGAEIARGGMGRIVAATDRRLGRQVAMKICLADDPHSHERLLREASILSRLDHACIPPVFEVGRLRSGAPYFATRLIDGQTLEQRLRAAPTSWPALLPLVAAVAEAMAYVHDRGVIHRDLKPSNILIDTTGAVAIVDWGIARVIGPDRALDIDLDLTSPGTPIGTPGYWPPEQRRGEPGDERSDIYTLGATLHRMVVGHRARPQVPAGTRLTESMAAAPDWLTRVVATATAEDPADRYVSVAALAAALRCGLAGAGDAGSLSRMVDPAPGRRRLGAIARTDLVLAALLAATCSDLRPSTASADDAAPIRATAEALTSATYWEGDFERILFEVEGDAVHGVYAHDGGVFEGRIVGERIVGWWCEAPYDPSDDTGMAEFVVVGAPGGLRIEGRYAYRDDRTWTGRWKLAPIDGDVPPDLVARLATDRWRCRQPRP